MTFGRQSQVLAWLLIASSLPGTFSQTAVAGRYSQQSDSCAQDAQGDVDALKDEVDDTKKEIKRLTAKLDDLVTGAVPTGDPGLGEACDCRSQASGDSSSVGCTDDDWAAIGYKGSQCETLNKDATHGCMKIYQYALQHPGAPLLSSSCKDVAGLSSPNTGCGEVRRQMLIAQTQRAIAKYQKDLDGDLKDRDKEIKEQIRECRRQTNCANCGDKSAYAAMQARQPGWPDYAIGAIQALTPAFLGGLGMYYGNEQFNNSLNKYSDNYGQYLSMCMNVGIPCGSPMMMGSGSMGYNPFMTTGGGFCGFSGMMPGLNTYGYGMMPGMGPGMIAGITAGMVSGYGGYGMMPGMMNGMMVPSMGMMPVGMGTYGMMPGMGVMPGMGYGYGMAPGMAAGINIGFMTGMMPGMTPGMMSGLYPASPMFTAGYGVPYYPYGTGFSSNLFPMGPIGVGPGTGFAAGLNVGFASGMYPGMNPGIVPGGLFPGSGYAGGMAGGLAGGFSPGWVNPGIGGMAGGLAGGYPGGFAGGLNTGFAGGLGYASGGFGTQYQSMMQQQLLQQQSAAQNQEDLMIAQQQLYQAQLHYYQNLSGTGFGFGYGGMGLAGGGYGGMGGMGGLAGGGFGSPGGGLRPF
jgi:hypothetical protein